MWFYSSLINNISDLIDPGSNFINNHKNWEAEFTKLASKKVTGYYYGSPLIRRRVGVIEIFEGQACFFTDAIFSECKKRKL